MPGRSKISPRLNALLLVAALAFVQVCTGFTDAFASAANVPAAAKGCCGGGSEPDCATARVPVGGINPCAPYCVQRQDGVKSDPVVPVSASFAFAGSFLIGRSIFPPHEPRLSAAPRAANTIPLIYQFQRLLN